jgi:hypothetical protein
VHPLTVRAVHAEYLNDYHLSFYLGNGKLAILGKAEILLIPGIFGNRKNNSRQAPSFRRWFGFCKRKR